jgi:hypothetical protein
MSKRAKKRKQKTKNKEQKANPPLPPFAKGGTGGIRGGLYDKDSGCRSSRKDGEQDYSPFERIP